jgi:hypothetical protein
MSPRARIGLLAAILALAAASPALAATTPGKGVPRGKTAAPVDTTHVSYLAGSSIYLEAGRTEGIAEGDTIRIVRSGAEIAQVRVTYASSHRAVCDTLSLRSLPRVGDLALYRAHPPAPADSTMVGASGVAAGAAAGSDSAGSKSVALSQGVRMSAMRPRPVQGRVALGYLGTSGIGGGYRQPSLDAYVQGRNALGGALDYSIDFRSHRTYLEGATDDQTRLYSFAATIHDATGSKRLTMGRQVAPSIGAAGHFDGLLAEYRKRMWAVGVFSGFAPAPDTYGFDTSVRQAGGYVRLMNARPGRAWSFLLGGLDSRDDGVPNRTAVFAQGSYSDRRLYLSFAQDVDFNASWKQDMGEAPVEPTATLAVARLTAGRGVVFQGGYDNRRNVRLAVDRLTPEALFDASQRTGFWAGVSAPLRWNVYADAVGRRIDGGAAGSGWSASGALEARRITPMNGALRFRSTRVDGQMENGWLHTAGFTVFPTAITQLALGAGVENMEDAQGAASSRLRWFSVDGDIGLGRHYYVLLSVQQDHTDAGDQLRNYAALSWIF